MTRKSVFVANEVFLDKGNFSNPITSLDHKLITFYPNFYSAGYDLRIIDHKLPTYPQTIDFQRLKEELPVLFHDPYVEVALPSIESLKEICLNKKVF